MLASDGITQHKMLFIVINLSIAIYPPQAGPVAPDRRSEHSALTRGTSEQSLSCPAFAPSTLRRVPRSRARPRPQLAGLSTKFHTTPTACPVRAREKRASTSARSFSVQACASSPPDCAGPLPTIPCCTWREGVTALESHRAGCRHFKTPSTFLFKHSFAGIFARFHSQAFFLHVYISGHFFSVFACIYSMSTRAILTNTIKPGLCILLPL